MEVFYAGSIQPKRRTFKDVEGYRGVVTVKNADQYVYFLQACGNDVRVGNYYSGKNIQFIADLPSAPPVTENVTAERQEQLPKQLQEEQQAATKSAKEVNTSADSEKEITFITGLIEKITEKEEVNFKIETRSGYKVKFHFKGKTGEDQK